MKKVNLVKSGNSTTVEDILYINAIFSPSFECLVEVLPNYRNSMNNMHKTKVVNKFISETRVNQEDFKSIGVVHKTVDPNDLIKARNLYHAHNLVAGQLSHPEAWGMLPIADSLSFTIEASKDELNRLSGYLSSKSSWSKSGLIVKPAVKSKENKKKEKKYKEESRIRNLYKNTKHIFIKGCSSPIYISYGLKGTARAVKQRPVRISFNPARFSGKDLKMIFSKLREAKIFNNFSSSLLDANVTRLDMAVDLIGVVTPMVIIDSIKVENYTFWPKEDNTDALFAKTLYVGSELTSHFVIYDKNEKKIDLCQKHVCSLIGPDNKPIDVTRIERVYKPQKNGTTLKLKDLANAPYIFKAAQVYSPLAYRELDSLKAKNRALRVGVFQAMLELSASAYEFEFNDDLSGEKRRIKLGNKQQIRTLSLKTVRKHMERYKVNINEVWFKERQKKLLAYILKQIISGI
ncbi:hypothetical protein [Rheinheimera oceanensis]|uniref:hypothetical protein n=1 Tax=Rheinheimera oceanensis TaxID=2817449 RepID=UPI001BFE7EDB|nr:hypothetical protein [Rheinheimera oceanensis]